MAGRQAFGTRCRALDTAPPHGCRMKGAVLLGGGVQFLLVLADQFDDDRWCDENHDVPPDAGSVEAVPRR
jgi:hypothetical protein